MFVVIVTYVVPLESIDKLLPAHVAFLDEHFAAGMFLAAGRQVPRTGGVILAQAESREALDVVLEQDPFRRAGAATYAVTDFCPVLVAPGLEFLREVNRS